MVILARFSLLLLVLATLPGLAQLSQDIKVNQVGYFTDGPKLASVVDASATSFEIRTLAGTTVHTGNLSSSAYWDESDENVKTIDFSSFGQTGDYVVYINGKGESYEFSISDAAYDQVSKEAMRYYYYNRCSFELDAAHAGIYARAGGHFDTSVEVCDNPFPGGRAVGSTFNSAGGWYDAGDYNKYTLTAGVSTYTLMSTYEQYPEYVEAMDLNLPESSNNIPDLLDECLFELNWLMTMQDSDGGVYQKISNKYFGAFEMPNVHDSNNGKRYACQKNTSATLQFSATMAAAYRIYQDIDTELPAGTRAAWKQAAIDAWNWAQTNNNVDAGPCGCDISTGWYSDDNTYDERVWAAAELYLATGDISYYNQYNYTNQNINIPNWANGMNTFGVISLLLNQDLLSGTAASDYNAILSNYLDEVDYLVTQYNSHPYKITMRDYWTWGSNGEAGNKSFVALTGYRLAENQDYLRTAIGNIDYILGKNTTSYSWLTGFGDKRVMDAHHRISGGDGITAPVPGMVFGGPYQSATGFEDVSCCGTAAYANTEVTINWNAPFAFCAVAVQAIHTPLDGPFTLKTTAIGDGSILVSPVKNEFLKGETVTLTATGSNGATFEGWGGSASGMDNPLTITMNSNKSVTALFQEPCSLTGDNVPNDNLNLALLSSATISGSPAARGTSADILYDPSTGAYHKLADWNEFGLAYAENLGTVAENDAWYWMTEWPCLKYVNYITFGGAYPNQPQNNTMWKVQYRKEGVWETIEAGQGGWLTDGIFEWGGQQQTPVIGEAIRVIAYSDGVNDVESFHLRARGGVSNNTDDSGTSPKATLIQYIGDPNDADCAGEINGTAVVDACSVCSGGNSGVPVDDCIMTSNVMNASDSKVLLYPNPTSGIVHLSDSHKWSLSTCTGVEVMNGTGESIDLSGFSSGVYLVKMDEFIVRLIKE